MKKNLKYKIFIIIGVVILLVLFAFSIAAIKFSKLTPCENEPDHFIDEFGNGYCIAREFVSDFAGSDTANFGWNSES